MTEQFGGIILAGGKSSRMGTDKGLMMYRGKLLAQYAIDLLRPLCSEIIISTNDPDYEQFGLKTVPDSFYNCGPLGGLHAALSESRFNYNMVVSCDVPFVVPELFSLLLAERQGADVVVPVHQNGIEPLVALYRKEVASLLEIKLMAGNYRVQQVIRSCHAREVAVDGLLKRYPDLFRNLNAMVDL
ncbi:molybdenum cofactor guanylyltransferase [Mangrovibacterium marinum]|uniref:Probable molybdenum cofactor guanylyltransferase n=1 Tax=Mangrovibacterium marinum TaxID=1639118 RepID=A0A2T5C2B4_9BACT|nr:molybdenum cofactor guanylyltransferase [Mangrovibacterium marinum]PTN08824.1 molybdenum cofactor guanylyltransferase [Mangrovibacterium marinum]